MHKANCFAHCKRETERTTKRPFYVTGDRGQRNLLKTRGPNMICQSLSVAVSDLGLYLHGTNEEPTAQTPRASEYPNLASFSKLDCSRRQAWSTKHRWKGSLLQTFLKEGRPVPLVVAVLWAAVRNRPGIFYFLDLSFPGNCHGSVHLSLPEGCFRK